MGRLQVVKANRLVQASYTLSLVEQRIILLSVTKARECGDGIKNDTFLKIHSSEYAKFFSVSKQSAQEAISNAVKTLFDRRVTIDLYREDYKKNVQTTIRWINAMSYIDNESTVEIRFNPEIVAEFTRLESNFTSYMLENIKDLNSAYSIRLYELLMQYKALEKTPLIEVEKFRQMMGLAAEEYKFMDDLKRRVLELALKQINTQTDLNATYEQVKSGRNIIGFIFKMQSKAIEPPKLKPKKPKAGAKAAAPVGALAGIDKAVFNDLKKAYPTLTEQYIFDLANKNNDSTFDTLQKMQQARRDGNFNLQATD